MNYITLHDRVTCQLLLLFMSARSKLYSHKMRNLVTRLPGADLLNRKLVKRNLLFPKKIYFESIARCNARCVYCPLIKMRRPKGKMNMGLFKKLVDEIVLYRDLVKEIYVHLDGEPLLDPEIIERMAYIKSKKLSKLILVTNGSLLDKEKARAVIDIGLDVVIFSVEGPPKEYFEKSRPPLKFETVRDNIFRLSEMRRSGGNLKPYIIMRHIVTPESKKYLKQYIDFWKKWVSGFSIYDVHTWGGHLSDNTIATPKIQNIFPCYAIFDSMIILWNGSVVPCCMDYDAKMALGDLNERTIKEVWQSQSFNALRNNHLNGSQGIPDFCDGCEVRNNIRNKPLMWKNYK